MQHNVKIGINMTLSKQLCSAAKIISRCRKNGSGPFGPLPSDRRYRAPVRAALMPPEWLAGLGLRLLFGEADVPQGVVVEFAEAAALFGAELPLAERFRGFHENPA